VEVGKSKNWQKAAKGEREREKGEYDASEKEDIKVIIM